MPEATETALEGAKMFVLLNEWAKMYWLVKEGKLTHQDAYEKFDKYARAFGQDTFVTALITPGFDRAIDEVTTQFGTIS